MRTIILISALLTMACSGHANPAAPSPPALQSAPAHEPQAPHTPAPALPPTILPIAVPTWQQALLTNIVATITDTATRETTRRPGLVVFFEILAIDQPGGTHIAGELYRPGTPKSGAGLWLSYVLIKDALDFPDKATFVRTLAAAVSYRADVRLVNGPIICCVEKPAGRVTGRFEGQF